MAAVDIGRLRLRGPPHLAARTAFLIEDACRTAIPDSERLILVRRLDLGRSGARENEHPAAVRRAYDAATAGAVHGGGEDRAGANCVWFASRAEARRLLLEALLAGRRPQAWYWRLAVPGWSGQSLTQWLEREVAAALDAQDDAPDLVEIVTMAVEAGAIDVLLNALGGPSVLPALDALPVPFDTNGEAPSLGRPGPEGRSLLDSRETVVRLRGRLPAVLVRSAEAVVRRMGFGHKAATRLLERLLVKASPSLSLSPALLRELTGAYGELIFPHASEAARPSPRSEEGAVRRSAKRLPAESAADSSEAIVPVEPRPSVRRAARAAKTGTADLAPAPAPVADAGAEASPLRLLDELRSPAAGLWLVLPSLIRMGFREWLAARPEILCADPGFALIRAIARHHCIAGNDPALLPVEPNEDPSPDWALLWRAGLDRWLRRRTHIPLARLVWRSGWIRLDEQRLVVRFAPGHADIRLRRRALDVDPGWTDWLGLSVRYAFADRAAP